MWLGDSKEIRKVSIDTSERKNKTDKKTQHCKVKRLSKQSLKK